MKQNKIKIGITFFWGQTYNDIWSNGAGQNIFFLKECLERISFVEEVYLVYWGNDMEIPEALNPDKEKTKIIYYKETLKTTNVLIEGTLTLEPHIEKEYRDYGAKIVSFRMGNDFIMDMEKFTHNIDQGRALNGTKYDAVWIIPHLMKLNAQYLEIMTGTKAYQVPHLWSPIFLNKKIKELGIEDSFFYKPSKNKKNRSKRISVFEPNISVMKNCMTPVLVCEQAYKQAPNMIDHVYLCNTYDKRNLKPFFNFIGYTELVKEDIMTVEARFVTPYFLELYTDIMLAHQWECSLNYIYYEAMYGGYALVHNSPYLKESHIGFYYDEFDAYAGADALLNAIYAYDQQFEEHQKRVQIYLEKLLPTASCNINTFSQLLLEII